MSMWPKSSQWDLVLEPLLKVLVMEHVQTGIAGHFNASVGMWLVLSEALAVGLRAEGLKLALPQSRVILTFFTFTNQDTFLFKSVWIDVLFETQKVLTNTIISDKWYRIFENINFLNPTVLKPKMLGVKTGYNQEYRRWKIIFCEGANGFSSRVI